MDNNNTVQLTRTSIKAASSFFTNQVANYIRSNMANIINDAEAARLVSNLCIKAQANMEEAKEPITWEMIDEKKFIMDAVKVVALGLDASLNECYPIPYKNTKGPQVKYELQCSPSAKGLVKLTMQYAASKKKIDSIKGYMIREGDRFTLKRTPNDDIWEFEQDIFNDGPVKGYVTIVSYEDGTSFVMSHTKADIEKRRKASKAPNSPAWTNWYDEMAMAKAMRRHCNQIPMQMPKAVQAALTELDDDEPQTKDVTPPTITLEATNEQPQADKPLPPAERQTQPAETTQQAKTVDEIEQLDMSWLGQGAV